MGAEPPKDQKKAKVVHLPRVPSVEPEKVPRDWKRVDPDKYSASRRWTPALAAGGHVPVVRAFLEHYASMQPPLNNSEAMFVIHLMSFKWSDGAPYPSYRTLAKRMGCTEKQVRRHAKALESVGYLRREARERTTNRFHLVGLFTALEKHLEKKLAAKAAPDKKSASDEKSAEERPRRRRS
jgi:hypothetical protein